jgi:glycerophosphoryl diester phosphodiesterase
LGRRQHATAAALSAALPPRPPPFNLIAHRGGQEILPENTLPAFLSAIERLGPDPCIEFDVQLTSDAVPVVIHDDTIDRTAGAVSIVAYFTSNGRFFWPRFHQKQVHMDGPR